MTLKEKFNALVPEEFGGMKEPLLSDCEKISDEYAIEFSEWMAKEYWLNSSGKYLKSTRTLELLEIFKKEKGL